MRSQDTSSSSAERRSRPPQPTDAHRVTESPSARAAGPDAAQGPACPPAMATLQRALGNRAVTAMLQRAAGSPAAGRPDPSVHDVLRAPGRPLDGSVRNDMEARLGADFSDVRVHTGSAAEASAASLGARAYTSGSHVVIGAGGADPHTLAHELTHVVQQRQGPVAGTDNGSGLRVSDPADRFEREAEATARRVMSRAAPAPKDMPEEAGTGPGARVQRLAVQRAEQDGESTTEDRREARERKLRTFLSDFRAFAGEHENTVDFTAVFWEFIDKQGLDGGKVKDPVVKLAQQEWDAVHRDRANAEAEALQQRIAGTRADRRDTWTMTGDVSFANGAGGQHLSGNIEGDIKKNVVRVNIATGRAEPVLNRRYHIHVDSGSNGAAVIFLLDDDFRVRPVVYDYSNGRTGNKYRWVNGSVDYDSSAPVPGLEASVARAAQLGTG